MCRKGQVFSSDFMIASSIFIMAFSILIIYWTHTSYQIEERREINQMIEKAYIASEVWFREGIPKYWNSTNVIDLGLSNDHRINQTKLNALQDIGYDRVAYLIGLGIYDYNLTIYNSTNDILFTFGKTPPNTAKNIIKARRIGIYNGSIVSLEVIIWD